VSDPLVAPRDTAGADRLRGATQTLVCAAMKVLIYISWPVKAWCIGDEHVATLRERFPDVTFVHETHLDAAGRTLMEADVAFTPFLKAEMIAQAPRLQWVHSSAAAVEGLLPLDALAEHGIKVTNSRGVQAIPMAEHVMGGLLVLSRRFNRTLEAQRERRWIQNDLCDDWPWMLHGQSMTIVGLGTIGLEVAKRAHAFGMRVTGVRRRTAERRPEFIDRLLTQDRLGEALTGCDVLVVSAPGVSATQRMIGAKELALLNRGAILVNVARAQIVDDAALRDALGSGQLGGAVLDVFEREPLDEKNPLWSMPNVVVTPHSSGFRASHWTAVVDLFTDNLRRFQRGDELRNVVDTGAGY
jgi:D-2-hydroxyacid dehydrogenase (NADP+)